MVASVLEVVPGFRADLGECPVWCPREEALYFIDCAAPALFRLTPASGALRRWDLPGRIGSFALAQGGAAILALEGELVRLDLDSGALSPRATVAEAGSDMVFNDGGVAPDGSFWAGTMHRSMRQPVGTIWRVDGKGHPTPLYRGLFVPNGLAWSPDRTRFYFSDSPCAMFVADAADPSRPPSVLAPIEAAPGWPDGSAIDSEGCLWNARWDGNGIARFTPGGTLDRFVALPVTRPTSCAFGGARLERLYVTSARLGLAAEALAAEPLAGALLALDVGARGIPLPSFAD